MTDFLYRYYSQNVYSHERYDPRYVRTEIRLDKLRVLRRTAKGCWVEVGYKKEKFVLDVRTGHERRYAYADKRHALNSLRLRKQYQVDRAKRAFRDARATLRLIKVHQEDGMLP